MRNYKLTLCLLVVVIFMLVFAGCNNDAAETQSTTKQTTCLESTTNSIAATEKNETGSTELFCTDADDLEIMTAPAPESNSQKTTEAKESAPAFAHTEATKPATEQPSDAEPTRIELPFVPAQ